MNNWAYVYHTCQMMGSVEYHSRQVRSTGYVPHMRRIPTAIEGHADREIRPVPDRGVATVCCGACLPAPTYSSFTGLETVGFGLRRSPPSAAMPR